jgi:hypothetical protein
MLLAIDPGVSTGWAMYFFTTGKLWACGASDPRSVKLMPSKVVIERPQVYNKRNVDPNDLVTLAIQVGRYEEHFAGRGVKDIQEVLPRDWKGTLGKDVVHRQCTKIYSKEEQATIDAALKGLNQKAQTDLLDACALGLWALNRYPNRGV